MSKNKNHSSTIAFIVYAFIFCFAANKSFSQQAQLKTSKIILDDFMSKRFGMFIHWGPVTLRGQDISWSRGRQIEKDDYDSLYKEFNPVLFNADNWVKAAKDAGMKYLCITAKHHDGFCLWPSKYSRHTIAYTPFKKDVVGALSESCKKYGIKFCIYYSVLDWYNPDYPMHSPDDKEPDPKSNMSKYIVCMKNQLRELISQYHPYMMWFDGAWESPWTNDMAMDMYAYLKSLDKNLIINNRLGKEVAGLDNKKIDQSKMIGDYDTPEQTVGRMNMEMPWESCITICKNWAWVPDDKMKTLKECLQLLVKAAGGNGNLLLNVSPMLDGRMEARQIERLHQIGEWMDKYSEAIYGTHGGPFIPNDIFASTRSGNKIYLHVFNDSAKNIVLPELPGIKIQKAYFVKGQPVTYTQDEKNITVSLPQQLPDKNCSVIVFELDHSAEQIPIVGK